VAIWLHYKRVLSLFSPRMRRNGYLWTSGQKSDPAIRSGDLYFLYDRCISATEWRIRDIFDVFVLLPCDLDLWPFDLESVSCTVLLMSDPKPIFIILRLSVTDLRVLNIWSHFRYMKQSLRMRRVTWPLTGGKNSPHFWNHWPQFAYSLWHFHGATTKIKPCYRQKIACSHYERYKVYCACAVSRDLCIGGPPKPHVTICWPRIAYSIYNFMRLPWRLRVVYIWASPC